MITNLLTHEDKEILLDAIKRCKNFQSVVNRLHDPNYKLFSVRDMLYLMNQWKKTKYSSKELVDLNRKSKITRFIRYCFERNKANFDTMILLTGEKGGGKSSTAIQLARAWCRLLGIRFNPRRHIAYSNKDVMSACDKLNKFEPLIADEAIRFATSENWNKSENKDLKIKLGQIRTKHLFYVLCFPINITKLDKTYLNDYVHYWIHLYKRGGGVIFIKNQNVALDPWNLEDIKKLGSWTEFTDSELILKKLKTHPNFWDNMTIPPVPEKLYNLYLKVRENNVYNDSNVRASVTSLDLFRAGLLMALQDIMSKDKTTSSVRILKYLENTYKIQLSKGMLNTIMEDAKQLLKSFEGEEIKDD